MNSDTIAGNWKQLKGKIQAKWGDLIDDDFQVPEGNSEYLVGKLQERYGWPTTAPRPRSTTSSAACAASNARLSMREHGRASNGPSFWPMPLPTGRWGTR